VIQERIEAPVRELQAPCGATIAPTAMHLHLGEYVFGGKLTGFLARASTALVLSDRSDDRVLPALVIEGELDAEKTSHLAHP
jgi:hypothetical protein